MNMKMCVNFAATFASPKCFFIKQTKYHLFIKAVGTTNVRLILLFGVVFTVIEPILFPKVSFWVVFRYQGIPEIPVVLQ